MRFIRVSRVWQRRMRRTPKVRRLIGVFGSKMLHADLWHISRESLSSGLALGTFIAFTPTIGLQMLLATIVAIWYRRANLPIALAACWITNPFTVIPIYLAGLRVGQWLTGHVGLFDKILRLMLGDNINPWFTRSMQLTLGLLVFGTFAAIIANLAMRGVWDVLRHMHERSVERKH